MLQSFLEVMGTFGSGFLAYLILEAAKYGRSFKLSTFWTTNVKPLLWSLLGSVIVAASSVFFPESVPFIEETVGEAIDITSYSGLILSGTVVGGIIKSILSNNRKTQAKKVEP